MAQKSNILESSQPAVAPRRPWRRWPWRMAALVVTGVCAWKLLHVFALTNQHTVIAGQIYRGAQPSPADLERLVKRHGIRTIVNLRGTCHPQEWYLAEAKAVQELGLSQEDLTFSAGRWPSHLEMRQLVEVLDRAERPLFLHCRQGADRTGMASVIALLLARDVSYAEARRQMSLLSGHAPFGRTAVLDRFFELYEVWLLQTGREHDSVAARHWLLNEYRGGQCQSVIEAVQPMKSSWRVGDPLAFRVTVRNSSDQPWHFKPTRSAGMHVGFQMWDQTGNGVVIGRAGLFEKIVPPGESLTVTLVAPPVNKAGRYRLMIDMVDEWHCWFFQTGSEPWEENIDVRD